MYWENRNVKVHNALAVLAMAIILIFSDNIVYASSGAGADPFPQIMTLICGMLQEIGGIVCFVGAFMIIMGKKKTLKISNSHL